MIHKDSIAGGLLLALAAGYYGMSRNIPASSLSDEVGADGMPNLLAVALAIVASLLLVKGLFASHQTAPVAKSGEDSENDAYEHAGIRRAIGFATLGVGYMVFAPLVGFAAGIAMIVVAVALYEREAFSSKLLAIAVAGGLGFWLVFVRLLGTEQPASSLLAFLMNS